MINILILFIIIMIIIIFIIINYFEGFPFFWLNMNIK